MAKAVKRFFCKIFSKINGPVQNTIVFESNPEFSGNTGAVYEEMLKRGIDKKYQIIWLVKDKNVYANDKNNDILYLEYRPHSIIDKLKRFYYLNRAKAIIFENRIMFKSWKNQFVINLMHGMPLKSSGKYWQYDTCDYVVSSAKKLNNLVASELAVPEAKVISLGYARNDVFSKKSDCLKSLGLEKYKDVVVWMPTFRKRRNSKDISGENYPGGIPLLDKLENIKKLNEALEKAGVCLVVKLHPEQDDKNLKYINESNVKYIGDSDLKQFNVKPYELLAASSAMLSDYSSVYYDYLLTDNPIGLVIDDMEAFKHNRGLAIDDYEASIKGVYIYTFDDLVKFLLSLHDTEYCRMKEISWAKKQWCDYTDGKSAKRIADFILERIK